MGSHVRQHPQFHLCYSPTSPANCAEDTAGGEHAHVPPRGVPTRLLDKLLLLQEKMITALEQLLTNRAAGDFHHKELDLNTELVACLNEAQAAKAIEQATEAIK